MLQENQIKLKGGAAVEKQALTIKETAKEFQFPEWGLRTLVKQGAFPVIQCGNRVYICRDVFAEYLKQGGKTYVNAH